MEIAPLTWAQKTMKKRSTAKWVLATLLYVVVWQAAVYGAQALVWDTTKAYLALYGTAVLFFIGLTWVVWLAERASQRYHANRRADEIRSQTAGTWEPAHVDTGGTPPPAVRGWNPLDQDAWYYGRKGRKLNQSLAVLTTYSVLFLAVWITISQLQGCQEIYEMPAGGGQQKALPQTVKIQKVIRHKFVVNPYSAILFEVPPIDEIKLQLNEVTEHAYTVGYGQGEGAGFGAGTARGKVRFIRLEYSGGDWDQDFGVGADLNMLIEYGIRTGHKVADQTESRAVLELRNFPVGKSPPMVYMTGQKNIGLGKSEIRTLRDYMLKQHGMLFIDNGGSRNFHSQVLAMMSQVLPDVRPVAVPLDDVIHRIPYRIPFLPYVAPHGGKEALGWWVDGRWVCYYHPGDINDAWCDDHSGVPAEIWETCYQLGTNVIFYAHTEYAKWLEAQGKKQ